MLIFAVVMFHEVATNTERVSIETLLLGKYRIKFL